jgi:hypothetical protein
MLSIELWKGLLAGGPMTVTQQSWLFLHMLDTSSETASALHLSPFPAHCFGAAADRLGGRLWRPLSDPAADPCPPGQDHWQGELHAHGT